tara:strand:- start:9478 stop:9867 length:390 start_codon:yes stop_codon:yes gene_type:complete
LKNDRHKIYRFNKISYLRIHILRLKMYLCFNFLQKMDKKTEEFYERLEAELDRSNEWPALYLYKFIVPSVADNVERVALAFDCMGAVIKTTKSKTGKYTSVSVDVTMKSAKEIIQKYQEVSAIEGVVSL